jgi:heterodisulfide reductase subunit C
MPIVIRKEQTDRDIKNLAEEISGVKIDDCLQCRRCTNGCPVAPLADSSPAEMIRQLQLGAGDELLASEMVWLCASCETCFSRCPMKINMAAVMDALRIISQERGIVKPEGNMPLMNRSLLGTIRLFGRTYDLGAMMAYKAGTSTYFRDTEKFPAMLAKGKIALFPQRVPGRKRIRKLFKKFIPGKDRKK